MTLRSLTAVLFFCCAVVPVTARPQQSAQSLQTAAQAGVPQTIVLPKIVVAGQRATLAVIDAAGRLVPAVDIDLSSGAKVSTDDTGRASFLAPAQTGILTARITETTKEFNTTVWAIPKDSGTLRASVAGASAPRLIAPREISLQERFDILGSNFSGEAYSDTVVLGNLPALVLAASPVSLVAQPNPRTSPGLAELVAGVSGVSNLASLPVTVVSLQVVGPVKPLAQGDATVFVIRASGSNQRLLIEVSSLTPDVANFAQGATEYWLTSGGSVNETRPKLRAVKSGNYSLNARLVNVGEVNIETAREQLLAARQLANAPWQKALDQLIRQMERAKSNPKDDPQHAVHFRQQLDRLLRYHPPEPPAGLLLLARQSLGWETT